jgi:hypothetical protein
MHAKVWIVAVYGLATLSGCAKGAPEATAIPGPDASIEDYEQALQSNEERLRREGITVAPAPEAEMAGAAEAEEDATVLEPEAPEPDYAAGAPARDMVQQERRRDRRAGRERCDRICDLAEATCNLEARICAMADRHAGEARYRSACQRASDQCRLASDACSSCFGR